MTLEKNKSNCRCDGIQSPGLGTFTGPRTIVEVDLIALIVLVYFSCRALHNATLDGISLGVDYDYLDFDYDWILRFYILLHFLGYDFIASTRSIHLRKVKDVYREFIAATKVKYLGKIDIVIQNVNGVLHPVDFFLKHIYDFNFPKQCILAMNTYKRTNPTLELKLQYLEKFAEPNVEHVPIDELHISIDAVLRDVLNHDGFDIFASDARRYVDQRLLYDLRVDLSSACGFPYAQGLKRRDRYADAVNTANLLMDDFGEFEGYSFRHVWYTTGRAKMQEIDKVDSGRLIAYAGFSYMLIGMLFTQPWANFMNSFSWCGVGFSWMNGGAGDFAGLFKCNKGLAPHGFRYVSVDIKEWDTKLHHDILDCLRIFYDKLMGHIGIQSDYVMRFLTIITDMINAKILFPLGHLFKVNQGMKSGWCNTANDNTLIHEIVFRCIIRRLGPILHILYGDDNFMLVPDHITDSMICAEYARFGLVVGAIHSSRALADVDWLAKNIIYHCGEYYVFRPAVETHARLLMPEEMDPKRRDRPDPVIAAERVLGHLLDNPFNEDVRKVCYHVLTHLRDRYGVLYIDIDDDVIRRHPWRHFDRALIPRKFPTIPSLLFIEKLYGVPIPSSLRIVWPAPPHYISYGEKESFGNEMYFASIEYSNEVMAVVSEIGKGKIKQIVKKVSPYSQPKLCYGFHAARMEFSIKYFGIDFDSLLDFGAHPGACAASALKYCNDITCVSLQNRDDDENFCPYVGRHPNVALVKANANKYRPLRKFDLLHDDVDIVGSRSRLDEIEVGRGRIARAMSNYDSVEQCLFSLTEIDTSIIVALYDLYAKYGYIDFVKPGYSNPWKSEFMVYARKEKVPRIRKNLFFRKFNGFLNDMAPHILKWAEILMSAGSSYQGLDHIPINPYRTNDDFEANWIRPWLG